MKSLWPLSQEVQTHTVTLAVCKGGATGNSGRGKRSEWLSRRQETLLVFFCLPCAFKEGAFALFGRGSLAQPSSSQFSVLPRVFLPSHFLVVNSKATQGTLNLILLQHEEGGDVMIYFS